ncbi:MAG: hypothetical protein P4L31_04555 [Candidatus Babeliales bacterium]|nr:hypothetical protein [Candidatus Babeliales bacterium]
MRKLLFLSLVAFASFGNMFSSSAPQEGDKTYVILDYTQPVKYIRAYFQPSNELEPRYLLTIARSKDAESKVFRVASRQLAESAYDLKVVDIALCLSQKKSYKAQMLLKLESAIKRAKKAAKKESFIKEDIYTSWDTSSYSHTDLMVGKELLSKR